MARCHPLRGDAGHRCGGPGGAEREELAKLAQNPIGNLISVPFQNNANLNYGPEKKTQDILNIQPVIPISVDKDWNIITRTIMPVIWNPSLGPDTPAKSGFGDIQLSAFLSPANPGHWIWGVGSILQIPTNSNADLGDKNWGLGPTFVVLHLEHGNPWVYGVLINNVWSLTSDKQGGSYNNGLIQPFLGSELFRGTVPDLVAGSHGRLEGEQRPAVDGAAGRRRRQDLPLRQAPGEHPDLRVLQRCEAGFRGELADSRAGAVDVSQMTAGAMTTSCSSGFAR